jgi:hypothetical protein
MPTEQKVIREFKGLYGHYNPIYEAPDGSALVAENVFINREHMFEKSRGFLRYGAVTADIHNQYFEYRGRLVRLQGSKLSYDSDGLGTFIDYTGSFTPAASPKSKALEAQQALYMTINTRVYKTDALATSPFKPGMPPGLDLQITNVPGTGNGWLPMDTQVGYRVLFVRVDANNVRVPGEPSFRMVTANVASTGASITRVGTTATVALTGHPFVNSDVVEITGATQTEYNGSFTIGGVVAGVSFTYTVPGTPATPATGDIRVGKDVNTSIIFTVPRECVATDYYEIYRTPYSAGVAVDPGDEHFRIYSAQIGAGSPIAITFSDVYDEAFLGTDLYTNQSQETITQLNMVPPFCKDVSFYKGYVFYSNTSRESWLDLQLIGIATLVDDTSSIAISGPAGTLTYKFSAAENIGARKFKRWTSYATTAENVAATALSFCHVVNNDTGNTEFYAFYTSGPNDAPGMIEIRMRQHNAGAFTVVANNSTTGVVFQPIITTAQVSQNDACVSRMFWSKFQQPDAVPPLNFKDIGSDKNDPIVRIIANRDSLFIFKKREGVFRFSGEGLVDQFALKLLDPTINVKAVDTVCLLENAVYACSTQGIVKIDEGGAAIVSRPIETDFKQQFSFLNFETLAFGVGYESERQYWVFTQEFSTDTYCTIAWVYNYLTTTWTVRRKNASCGLVLSSDDRIYLGHAVDKFVLQERKSFGTNLADYTEESIAVTITAVASDSVTLTYIYSGAVLAPGFLITKGIYTSMITGVTSLGTNSYRCTLYNSDESLFTVGAATVVLPVVSLIQLMPQACGDVAVLKQFPEIQFYMTEDSATNHKIAFYSDLNTSLTYVDDIATSLSGFGLADWGDSDWGDEDPRTSTPLRTPVPREFQRCRALTIVYKHDYAQETFTIAGLAYNFRNISSRTARNNR